MSLHAHPDYQQQVNSQGAEGYKHQGNGAPDAGSYAELIGLAQLDKHVQGWGKHKEQDGRCCQVEPV